MLLRRRRPGPLGDAHEGAALVLQRVRGDLVEGEGGGLGDGGGGALLPRSCDSGGCNQGPSSTSASGGSAGQVDRRSDPPGRRAAGGDGREWLRGDGEGAHRLQGERETENSRFTGIAFQYMAG